MMMILMIDEGPPPKQDAAEVSKLRDFHCTTCNTMCHNISRCITMCHNISQCENCTTYNAMYHNVSRCENVRCFLSDGDHITEDPFPPLFNRCILIICVAQPNPPTEIPVGQRGKVSPPHFYNPGPLSQIQIAILPLSDTIVSRHVMLFDKC